MAFGLLRTSSGHLEDACYSMRLDRSGWGALQKDKHIENLGSSDLATCNRINDFHSPACAPQDEDIVLQYGDRVYA
jgi:hypothetical protein